MKTLITGATGFIGSHLVRQLVKNGEDVRCLIRPNSDLTALAELDVETVHGDITEIQSLRRAVKGCDRVYHLAAVYAIWLRKPGVMYQVNEEGTRNILTVCAETGIQKVLYCSSTAALGAHGKTPAIESAVFNLTWTKDHYYISKFRAEQIALGFAKRGLPVVIVNPTVPVGPGDRAPTPSGAMIVDLLKGNIPAYVDGGFNVIDVNDCVQGMIQAMQKGNPGESYILGSRNLSVKNYFDMVVDIAGQGKSPGIRLPGWVAVSSGYAYQTMAWFTGKTPLTSASWARVGSGYSWWDCTKAKKELDLGQRAIEKSIAEAVAWFREQKYI